MRSGTTRRSGGSRNDTTGGSLTTLTSSTGDPRTAHGPAARAPDDPAASRAPGDLGRVHRRRGLRALGAGVAALAVVSLSGCANPEYRFVSNNERDVVVRVPWSWTRIDPKDVEKIGQTPEEQEAAQDTPDEPGSWLAYFDSAKKPAPTHIVGDNLPSPVVVLRSGDVPAAARDTLTLDQLRDLVFPVSDAGRAQQQVQAQATGQKLPEFKLVTDDTVKTKTASGVHLVFSVDGEVFDQVAVTDVKRTRFHLLLVHCSQQCYDGRKGQITVITDSFTIKKP